MTLLVAEGLKLELISKVPSSYVTNSIKHGAKGLPVKLSIYYTKTGPLEKM